MDEQVILDPHIIHAILAVLGAVLVAGGLLIWFAVEAEMKDKR